MSSRTTPQPSHVTHRLECGCIRHSDGTYTRTREGCLYPHKDRDAGTERSPYQALVSFSCGCFGYCRCGKEDRLREARMAREAKGD